MNLKFISYPLLFVLISFLYSCGEEKIKVVVFPEYCGGCVENNFQILSNQKLEDQYELFFDTTDYFILNEAKRNHLKFNNVTPHEVRMKFGDYANIILIDKDGSVEELSTISIIDVDKYFAH